MRGFTIVELLSAVAIIGVLAALMMPRYHAYKVRARRGEAKVNLGQIKSLQSIYQVEHYEFKTLALTGYEGSCDFSDGTDPAALGFTPDDCAKMRYGYAVGTSSSKEFTATAFAPSNADQRWIYPRCSGAGASDCSEAGAVSSGDKLYATNKTNPEVCRNITKYCPVSGGGGGGGMTTTTCSIASCPAGEILDPGPPCKCVPNSCTIASCPAGETLDPGPPCKCLPTTCSNTCSLNSSSNGAWSSWSPALTCPGPDVTQTRTRTVTEKFDMPTNACATLTSCPDQTKTETETRTESCTSTCDSACVLDTANKTETWTKEAPIIDAATVCIGDTEQQKEKGTITTPYKMPANPCVTLTSCPADKVENKDKSTTVNGAMVCCAAATHCCNSIPTAVLTSSGQCDATYDLDPIDCSCSKAACKNTCDEGCTEWVEGNWAAGWTPKNLGSQVPCWNRGLVGGTGTQGGYKQEKARLNKRTCDNVCSGIISSCPLSEVEHKYKMTIGKQLCWDDKPIPPDNIPEKCHVGNNEWRDLDAPGVAKMEFTGGGNCRGTWGQRGTDKWSYYDRGKMAYYKIQIKHTCVKHVFADLKECTVTKSSYRKISGTKAESIYDGASFGAYCNRPEYECQWYTDVVP